MATKTEPGTKYTYLDDVLPIYQSINYLFTECGIHISGDRIRMLRIRGGGPPLVVNRAGAFGHRKCDLRAWAQEYGNREETQQWTVRRFATKADYEDARDAGELKEGGAPERGNTTGAGASTVAESSVPPAKTSKKSKPAKTGGVV